MATREYLCVDCTQPFAVQTGFRSGRTPIRCQACRLLHVRAQNRAKTYRWRARYPEKAALVRTRANAKRLADPEHLREKREREVQRTYGLAPEQARALLDAQGGACAICGRVCAYTGRRGNGGTFHIDHDHATGVVRGLLCGNCNTMIGLAKEDPSVLTRAAAYLTQRKVTGI